MNNLLTLLVQLSAAAYTDVYNFPMLGILQYDLMTSDVRNVVAYGSVTIVHTKMVLAAAENLFQLDPRSRAYIFHPSNRNNLKVYSGSDVLQPPKGYDDKKIQISSVASVYFGWNSVFLNKVLRRTRFDDLKRQYKGIVSKDLDTRTVPKSFTLNPFSELQWDVAILTLREAIKWGPYTLPIVFHWNQDADILKEYKMFWKQVDSMEDKTLRAPCVVPGWSTVGDNQMIFHRVIYIRFKDCAESICGAYPSACLAYLNPRQHVCFKSLDFGDACVLDQGAPVVCPWARPFTLGVLVKTFDCGSQQLPSVFTRTYAIEAFARLIADLPLDIIEPSVDDPKYAENPI